VIRPDQLAGFGLLDQLTPEQRVAVASMAQEVTFEAGTPLFEEGQPASGCWLIRLGQVALEAFVPGRGDVVVQTLDGGDMLGWSWLVPPHTWHFTATASERVVAVQLDTTQLRALADADKALGYQLALGLIEVVVARLQSTRSRLLDLYGSPRER
jgi:CRP/FNR family transcriptional regulator, cyclic AMP receptor protein